MEAKNELNEAVSAAEDRVKALRERSMGLGLGDNIPSPANPEIFEEGEEEVAEEIIIDTPVANKKSNTPLIVGGVALLALVAFVVLRKRK